MITISKVYKTNRISVILISTRYSQSYKTQDYNPWPAISFPLRAAFRYKAGQFDQVIDTNTILVEKEKIDYEVTKFSAFTGDSTLTFQFLKGEHGFSGQLREKPFQAFGRTPQIEALLRFFLVTHSRNEKLYNDQLIDEILFQYLADRATSRQYIDDIKPWQHIRIDAAKDYIHNYYGEDISLEDIAASAHLSSFHFSRLFKQQSGYSPYDYLLLVRIEKAKLLLRQGASVTTTAFEVGFNSMENFSYGFKKIAGTTPSQYRKSKISKIF